MPSSLSLDAFLLALPKTETHLHIEGALPYDLLQQFYPERFLPDPEFRRPHYRYSSFPAFEQILLEHALPWFTSVERYYLAAKAIFERQFALNIRYVETSFHLPVAKFIQVEGEAIVDAILRAAPAGMTVKVFAGMPRNAYGGPLKQVIDSLVYWPQLAGVDLHGFEAMPTEPWTAPLWKKLRDSGKVTKCHAGEFDGASRVREAIRDLGCLRIEHGVRAAENPEVLDLAARKGAVFDVCPLSNVRLQVVPSIALHPLRTIRKAGVPCTLSTDDPLCFGNTLLDEYRALALEGGFSREELASFARTGWGVAQVPVETRLQMLHRIEDLVVT